MPRANRYHIDGHIWHITDRCHNRDFLLKFAKDRHAFEHWLSEAKRRFSLSLLNYIVTCNHVHLLVYDRGEPQVIEKSMQLIAGQVAQQYNRRKSRSGAFWGDRYHATAVQNGKHLRRCMRYIDLNMVRAGRVVHPSQWNHAGYHRIQNPLIRENRLDLDQAMQCLGFDNLHELQSWQRSTIQEALQLPLKRDPNWTNAIAIGDPDFLGDFAKSLNLPRHKHSMDGTVLHDPRGEFVLKQKHD
jgi:putative transposase